MSKTLAGGAGLDDHDNKSHAHDATSKGDTHMKAKILTIAGLCALAAALALPASGAAGTPPTVQPIHYTVTFPTSACGIDNLVETDTFAGVFKTDASGDMSGNGIGYGFTLTNPANGKAVRYQQVGSYDMSAPIPNGDGTYTVYFNFNGMFKYSSLPGGQPLESGEGHSAAVILLDSSFNFISGQIVHSGGSGPGNNNDPCPLIVSALT
jgi:hypothetical protein